VKSKEIYSCPEHLYSSSQFFIEAISFNGNEYVADLPNLDEGRLVLVSKEIADTIRRFWEEDRIALLNIDGGTVRNDEVLVPSFLNVFEQTGE
jgi:hypothetical protein